MLLFYVNDCILLELQNCWMARMSQNLYLSQRTRKSGLSLQTDQNQILIQKAGSQLAERLSRKAIWRRSELSVLLSTVIIAAVWCILRCLRHMDSNICSIRKSSFKAAWYAETDCCNIAFSIIHITITVSHCWLTWSYIQRIVNVFSVE